MTTSSIRVASSSGTPLLPFPVRTRTGRFLPTSRYGLSTIIIPPCFIRPFPVPFLPSLP
ncbi:MAG: hypothetical protein ACFFAS_07675 [Promethearchaeota archaeon]